MEEENRKSLGKEIRRKRQESELTLEDIANKLGTSKQNIGRYEKGNYIKPDLALLAQLCNLLSIDSGKYYNKITFTPIYNNTNSSDLKIEKQDLTLA